MKIIKLIAIDVDGTLTDGKIIFFSNGVESKNFNVKDGMAISLALHSNIEIVFITGRSSNIVDIRAKELGVDNVYQGVKDKRSKVYELSKIRDIKLENIAFIGDDVNDLEAMKVVGMTCCPSDASLEVKKISHIVSNKKGGEGAVREIIELILRKQGDWPISFDSIYTNQ